MGDFGERIDELIDIMGGGSDLTGKVEVNQVYAHYQHEGLDLRHPRGGQAKYLEAPLISNADKYVGKMARSFLEDGGIEGMADAMEDLSAEVEERAPVEFSDLKDSGHPSVQDDGVTVYDRPPMVPRLTEEQLRMKDRLRDLGFGHSTGA